MSASTIHNPYEDNGLGRAENTIHGDGPALKLFNYYRAHVLKREGNLSSIQYEEIAEDNFQSLFILLTMWLSSTPIPRNWRLVDGEMRPSQAAENNDGATEILVRVTLAKYVGRVVQWFRRRFPDHPDVKHLDPRDAQAAPDWWSRMLPKFEKEVDSFHQKLDSDFTFGAITTRPLYFDNNFEGTNHNDILGQIDLKSMLKKLMKDAIMGPINPTDAGPLQKRAWLSILYNAVGRSGELKYIDTANWMWHYRYQVIDILWSEMKTNTVQAMPMFADRQQYLLCFYHSLGSFWSVEGGLYRSEAQSEFKSFLFPFLHGMKDRSVSSKILNAIRDCLPKNSPNGEPLPKDVKNSFSGKSVRKATITELLNDSSLNYTDVCHRSGHESGTTLDSYEDKRNISIGMRGGKILAHYSASDNATVPTLNCLPADSVALLMKEMFSVSLPAFLPEGELHIVLRTSLASLIMHHNQVTFELSEQNAVSSKLIKAAINAKITDPRYPNEVPQVILTKWSDDVKKNFNDSNPDIARVTPDGANLAAAFNSLQAVVQSMSANILVLLARDQDRQQRMSQMESRESTLHKRVSELEKEKRELEMALSPQKATSPTRKRTAEEAMTSMSMMGKMLFLTS